MHDLLLIAMALGSLALYVPVSRRRSKRLCALPVDEYVPFIPVFVLPYVSLAVFFPLTFVALFLQAIFVEFLVAIIVVGILYALASPYVSCGAVHADAKGKGVLRALVRGVYRLDGPHVRRTFPSMHVYLSVICAYYLSLAFPSVAVLAWPVAALITSSTVLIKQHNLVDILGGALWAAVAISAAPHIAPFI